MSIPDGEYTLDLLALGSGGAVAIRYGFVPETMDHSKPVNLYQSDSICILEAQLVDSLAQLGVRALPIIFEGAPQQQKRGDAKEAFVVAFSEVQNSATLRPLGSTLRVNKSRSAEKWRNAIGKWTEGPGETHGTAKTNAEKTKAETTRAGKTKAETTKAEKTKAERAVPKGRAQKAPQRARAQKAPRAAKPAKAKSRAAPKQEELDDDFKDLEDQLQEVLNSPSESDSDAQAPIVVEIEGAPRKRNVAVPVAASRPLSMREAYGKKEDSSSEEE